MSAEGPCDAGDVTLAILNYNGRELLPIVLSSIERQTATGFAVHVLDDASTDDSLDYLAAHWPAVAVFPSSVNSNVTASMARAIELASTRYVALLNNDLELDPRWLAEMRAALEAHPEAASADGKMLRFHQRDTLDGAGDVMGRNGYPRRRGQGEPDSGQFEAAGEVFSATGGAALYRREAFATVGNFDTDFVAYYEDVDWGFRARLLGMTTRYVPGAVSYHVGSATTGAHADRFLSLIVRNQMLVVIKDFPAASLLRQAPRLIFFELKWLGFHALHGYAPAHLRGLAGALRALRPTLRKRRAIQRARTVSGRELERALL
jgi:GT2 family glycosyltransferase